MLILFVKYLLINHQSINKHTYELVILKTILTTTKVKTRLYFLNQKYLNPLFILFLQKINLLNLCALIVKLQRLFCIRKTGIECCY